MWSLVHSRRAMLGVLVTLLALTPSTQTSAASTKVFRLHGEDRTAVVEAVARLFGDRAKLALVDDRLVVSADDRVIEQIGELLERVDPAPRRLQFTFSSRPVDGGSRVEIYSTRGRGLDQLELHGIEGVPVVLSKVRTTERPVLGGTWHAWVAFEEVPVDEDSITLVATVDDPNVVIDVHHRFRRDDRWQQSRTTVSGPLGSWLPLVGRRLEFSREQLSLPTQPRSDRPLSVKVEPMHR